MTRPGLSSPPAVPAPAVLQLLWGGSGFSCKVQQGRIHGLASPRLRPFRFQRCCNCCGAGPAILLMIIWVDGRLFYLEELCCVRSWGREGSVPRRRRSLAGCFLWYVRGDLCMAQRCCYGGGGGCLCVIHTVWDVRIVVVFEWS
ncbi:uncharacterized protein [Lolium perenne]|uniref:uncharacterized protein isoform X2 n=1 Tax=Lolium perenne TaxID=4522 RepID=UPI0021F5FB04|nr:uncharacterized protein LOC127335474 [Lolium perenne]XP_051218087.1 uncharacterized protein LOC127335474 [Lolium perenne]